MTVANPRGFEGVGRFKVANPRGFEGVDMLKVANPRRFETPCQKTMVKHEDHFQNLKKATRKNTTFGGSRTGVKSQPEGSRAGFCLGGVARID